MSYVKDLLSANEKVLFSTRKHFFVILGELVREILILTVLVVGFFAVSRFGSEQIVLFRLAFGVVALIVIVSLIIDILRWRSEEYLVTNRRVIQCNGIMNKKVLDSSLSKINDVVLEQSFFGRIFNYGTIKILTATEEVVNLLDRISRPVALKQAMLNAKSELEPSSLAHPPISSIQLLEDLAQLKARNMITEEEYQEKRKEILKRI